MQLGIASLDPEMAAIDGFRAVLAELATAIDGNWQGTIDQVSPERLHELRIAVRRTRTILAVGKNVLPAATRRPARKGFAWLAAATGTPRDLDVYLLEWTRYTAPLGADAESALAPVHELLEGRHIAAHQELGRTLRSERAVRLMDEWRTWLDEPLGDEPLPRRAVRPLGREVAKRISRAHDALIDHGRLIGPDASAEQIHDLRKDAKKLRYLIECFGSLLPEKPRDQYVKRLKALQDNLGERQDAEVHILVLRDIASELDEVGVAAATEVGVGQLGERLDHQRLETRAEFEARFGEYDSAATRRTLDAVLKPITHGT